MASNNNLFSAVSNGNLSRIQELIATGANVNSALDDGATPLLIASLEGHTEI
jgi:ankyrin repeat protein